MLSPCEASDYIRSQRVPHGQNVMLPDPVDSTQCEQFFGLRCDCNLHLKNPRLAHLDRVDPRNDALGHLIQDVKVSRSVISTPIGATLGALLDQKNRGRGALIGGFFGLLGGIIADVISEPPTE